MGWFKAKAAVPAGQSQPLLPNGQRVPALDVLRGFALLGILIMNIPGYGLISADYLNPVAQGALSALDWFAWGFSHLFAEQKFMTIFCLLFGSGILILAERRQQKNLSAWSSFLRRSAGLLLIGLIHAYAIWYGDVLTTYAVAGLIAFALRRRSPRTLMIVGSLLLLLPFLYSLAFGLSLDQMPAEARAEMSAAWTPDAAAVAAERGAYLGGWLEQMPRRFSDALFLQTYFLLTLFLWRAAGLMLIGMALTKTGFLFGTASSRTYARVAVIGLSVGLVTVAVGIALNVANGWAWDYSMYLGNQFNYWGSIAVSLGYVSLVLLAVKHGLFVGVQNKLAEIGRVTLTIYILHGVLGTLIFYGHGLGYYDQIPRWGLLLLVVPIWALEFALVRYTFIGRRPLESFLAWMANGRRARSQLAPLPAANAVLGAGAAGTIGQPSIDKYESSIDGKR